MRTISSQDAIHSPISILPNEILSHIMKLATGGIISPPALLPDFFSMLGPPIRAPWNFPGVSRHWRAVALANTSMWARVIIPTLMNVPPDAGSITSFLKFMVTLIERAKPSKLGFTLMGHEADRRKQILYREVITLYIRSCEDWQQATFPVTDGVLDRLAKIQGRLPNLERLCLDCSRLSETKVLDMFKDAPQLTSFDVALHDLDQIIIPWAQLRHGKFDNHGISTIDILRRMPLIEDVEIWEGHNLPPSDSSHLTLPSLRKVAFGTLGQGCENVPFDQLTLPSLQTVKLTTILISSPDDPEIGLAKSLPRLISRSSCSIRELNFEHCPVPRRDDWIALFSAIPTLETLIVTEGTMDVTVFNDLTLPNPQQEGRRLVPLLKNIVIEISAITEGFVDCLDSRLDTLKKVHVTKVADEEIGEAVMYGLLDIIGGYANVIDFEFPEGLLHTEEEAWDEDDGEDDDDGEDEQYEH